MSNVCVSNKYFLIMNKGFLWKKVDRVHEFIFELRSGGQQNLISLSLLLLGKNRNENPNFVMLQQKLGASFVVTHL